MKKFHNNSFDPTAIFENHGGVYVPRIVRYFEKRRLRDTLNGRFWFSSIEGFAKGEDLRFSDKEEGKISFSVDIDGMFSKGLEFPGFSFKPAPEPYRIEWKGGTLIVPVNAYGMCFTAGAYDPLHHLEMIKFYPGLTEFAEIDTERLLSALSYIGEKNGLLQKGKIDLWATKVRYLERPFHLELRAPNHDGFDFKSISHLAWTRALFHKPLKFSHEREFRIVFGKNIEQHPNGLLLSSAHIKRSITKFGSISK